MGCELNYYEPSMENNRNVYNRTVSCHLLKVPPILPSLYYPKCLLRYCRRVRRINLPLRENATHKEPREVNRSIATIILVIYIFSMCNRYDFYYQNFIFNLVDYPVIANLDSIGINTF